MTGKPTLLIPDMPLMALSKKGRYTPDPNVAMTLLAEAQLRVAALVARLEGALAETKDRPTGIGQRLLCTGMAFVDIERQLTSLLREAETDS